MTPRLRENIQGIQSPLADHSLNEGSGISLQSINEEQEGFALYGDVHTTPHLSNPLPRTLGLYYAGIDAAIGGLPVTCRVATNNQHFVLAVVCPDSSHIIIRDLPKNFCNIMADCYSKILPNGWTPQLMKIGKKFNYQTDAQDLHPTFRETSNHGFNLAMPSTTTAQALAATQVARVADLRMYTTTPFPIYATAYVNVTNAIAAGQVVPLAPPPPPQPPKTQLPSMFTGKSAAAARPFL